jgi:tetratricopeptide (TPR) repeat protein/serine/threonine protein kinase
VEDNVATVEDIFLAAVEKAPADRAGYLDAGCGGDAEVRAQVEALLRSHEQAGSLLEQPLFRPGPTVDQPPAAGQPRVVVGPYKLIEPIGEGGMGTVWMAQQTEPVKRLVAVKLIKAGMDSRQVIARFEAERQALALMDHPNIARVLDGGETPAVYAGGSPRPYFVMDLVKGVPITKYCDEHHLTPRQRLELFIPVCQAIQHAHQKGIIHRDLKPSNVLVALYDGKPVPKVIDFGVAKAAGQPLTEQTLVTGFGALVGTLEYMSPEQAEVNQRDIDTRSDIYSLGVLLYELLTGSPPFTRKELERAGMLEMLRVIREQEPTKPSAKLSTTEGLPTLAANRGTEPAKLTKLVRGELDWIVMKCLEKDRNRRYQTAKDFAADVQRYLHDEPVQACPPSAWYLFRKFARRNRTALAVAGLILFLIAVLGGGGGWVVRDRAAREQQAAKEQHDRERRLTTQVELILDEVERLEREQKWPEARAAAERAETALAGGEADDAIRRRVAAVRRELAFVTRLDRIRQDRATLAEVTFNAVGEAPPSAGSQTASSGMSTMKVNKARAARDYALAFREYYGVNVEALAADEAVGRLRGNPALAAPVAAALDDWAACGWDLGEDASRWGRLVAVARGLDPDPLRDRLRAAWGRPVTPESQAELLELVKLIDVKAQRPATILALAQTLNRAQRADAARRIFQEGQYANPADFWLNFALGHQLGAQEDHAGALRYYTAAVALRPDSTVAHIGLGIALHEQGKLDEAVAEYRQAIALAPKDPLAHYLGAVLRDQGKLDEAVVAYRQAIALDPKFARAHIGLGRVLCKQKKLDEAVVEFHQAIAIDPKFAGAHIGLGNALRDQKKLDEAVVAYRQAIEIDPNDAVAHCNLGNVLRDQKKLDEAVVAYRQAIAIAPKFARAHGNLGNALRDQGKLDEAVAECRQAIALDPKLAQAHYSLGLALYEQKKVDEAVAEWRQAIALDPKYAEPHYDLGNALCAQKKLDEAVAEYRQAIALDPKLALAHIGLGLALHDQGKLDEAVAEFRWAVALDPQSAVAHNNLGTALREQKKLDEAIAELRKAIEIDPKSAAAHNNLGLALHDQGKLDEAVAECRQAIALDPKFAFAHNNLGNALRDQGKLDEAIAEYRQAIALDPKLAPAHCNLGNALRDQKKLDEAVVAYRQAIEIDPKDAGAHYILGNALRDQGKLDGAVVAYRQAIALKPEFAEAHCNLGGALLRKGAFRQALEELRRGHELGSKNPGWRYPSAQWVRHCERLVELDGKLPGFLDGKATPASAAERIELARLCWLKHLNGAATRFYKEAFVADPKLADDLGAAHRYNAACATALAGCGHGEDAVQLEEKEKARLRGQALDWLRADLAAMGRLLDKGADQARSTARVGDVLKHWQVDPDLAGVREADALAQLPDAERQPWQKLWQDVADILKRAQEKAASERK